MTRVECKEHASNYCRSQIGQNKVVYFVLDAVGKEDILSYVAETLGIQVVVTEDKYQLIQCMGLSKHFTTNRENGSVFCLSKSKFNYKKSIAGIKESHAPAEVQFVKISGMRRGQNCLSYEYIKFSDHSCMKEIELFFASLSYKSASPIMTKIDRELPKPKQTENTINKLLPESDKIKVKLRKNKEEQTSFSITSEFENSPAVSYRVVSGVTTDEEVGDSPDRSLFSPCKYAGRSCSTPIPDINDELLQELAIYHDYSFRDSHPSSEFPYSYVSGSPDRAPYIEPPIPLDWLPSPIKCEQSDSIGTGSDIQSDLNINDRGGLCSLGDDISPDIEDESSAEPIHSKPVMAPKVSPNFVFPRCSIQLLCNSPVYNMNGKISYPSASAAVEKEQNILNGGGVLVENHQSNVSMLYEEMFREPELTDIPPEITESLRDDFSDGIDVLNETPESVETLYVSDTESESGDDIEKAGPIGDYLRGQYALNQMFNSTVINIRENFNSSALTTNFFKRRKKITEDDLASTRIHLLLPKVVCSPEIKVKNEHPLESEGVRQARHFKENKDEYFRQLSEISKKCYATTYKKKPKKIGKSLPVSRALLSDSIHLLNDYTDPLENQLRDLAWKLTVDKIIPKTMPVLEIKKRPLSPSFKEGLFVPMDRPLSPENLMSPISDINHSTDVPITASHPLDLVDSKKTICIPHRSSTPKPSKNLKKVSKSILSQSSSPPIVNGNAKKLKKGVKTKSSTSTPKHNAPKDDIFDMLFGSTPTSLAVKRIKKRSKDPVSRKRINATDNILPEKHNLFLP